MPSVPWAASDDRYAPAFYEEFDLAFALRAAGRRVMYQPASVVTYLDAGISRKSCDCDAQSTKNHALFCRKWNSAGEPAAARQQPLHLA